MRRIEDLAHDSAPVRSCNDADEVQLMDMFTVAYPPILSEYNRARKRARLDNRNALLSVLTIASKMNKQ